MRRAIVGVVAAACVMGVVGSLAYVLMLATMPGSAQNWRQHRLVFLKSTYDRIQADIAVGDSAAPSWRRQEESVLRDMAVIAKPMPADSIPSDIRILLSASAPGEKGSEAATIGPAKKSVVVEPVSDSPIAHPSGASVRLRTIAFHRDSIILSATIANVGDHPIRLNRARSFVLVDSLRAFTSSTRRFENAEVEGAGPHTVRLTGDLVFIGPIAPSVHYLTLSTNDRIGTPDNPDDSDPALKAEIPVNNVGDGADEQANDPGGVALQAGPIVGGPATCGIPLLATNGTEHTIALSEKVKIALADEHGPSVEVESPLEDRQLIVPSGARLEAELVFDCRQLDVTAALTLTTNQDNTAGIDKGNSSRPMLKLRVARDLKGDGVTVAGSHASLALIARSQLAASPTAVAAAPSPEDGSATTPQAASTSAASEASPQALSARVFPEASSSSYSSRGGASSRLKSPAHAVGARKKRLHAEKTDRGLRIILLR